MPLFFTVKPLFAAQWVDFKNGANYFRIFFAAWFDDVFWSLIQNVRNGIRKSSLCGGHHSGRIFWSHGPSARRIPTFPYSSIIDHSNFNDLVAYTTNGNGIFTGLWPVGTPNYPFVVTQAYVPALGLHPGPRDHSERTHEENLQFHCICCNLFAFTLPYRF